MCLICGHLAAFFAVMSPRCGMETTKQLSVVWHANQGRSRRENERGRRKRQVLEWWMVLEMPTLTMIQIWPPTTTGISIIFRVLLTKHQIQGFVCSFALLRMACWTLNRDSHSSTSPAPTCDRLLFLMMTCCLQIIFQGNPKAISRSSI
jgi:hypothetical protein